MKSSPSRLDVWLGRVRAWMLLLFTTLALTAAPDAIGQEMHAADPSLTFEAWEVPALPEGWVSLPGVGFTIHGHADHDREMWRLLKHGDEAVPALADAMGVPLGGPVNVYLADSQETFRSLQPGQAPVWADGTAYSELGVIFLRHPSIRGGSARPLTQVLDHELVHVLLGRVFAPAEVPRWLQEGMAQVFAGEVGPEISRRISRGQLGADLYDLREITHGFPIDARRADLAYAQSADFILWFRATYGDDALQEIVRRMAAGVSVNGAMFHVTGLPLRELNTVWRTRLETTTSVMTSPEVFEGSLWAFAALLLLVGGFMRQRAFHRRMAEWEEEEAAIDDIARELLGRRRVMSRRIG